MYKVFVTTKEKLPVITMWISENDIELHDLDVIYNLSNTTFGRKSVSGYQFTFSNQEEASFFKLVFS